MMTPDSLKHTVVAPDGTSIANGTDERMMHKCHACRASSRVTFLEIEQGLVDQIAVLKETVVLDRSSGEPNYGHPPPHIRHRRQERDSHRQGSRTRSTMHADIIARWEAGSKSVDHKNATRTCEFTKAAQTGMDAYSVSHGVLRTEKLPSWVGVLALNHYQRSWGECKRKADFVHNKGSIFAQTGYLVRARSKTLIKRCAYSGVNAVGKKGERRLKKFGVNDTTVANEVPRIWEKLVELFGSGAKEHQYHVQRTYRQHVFRFLNQTEASDF